MIEGSKELSNEEIGAPNGTTFIVKDLFYNVPARRKFLKTAQTEGSYISDMVEKLALSHPDISFKFITITRQSFTPPETATERISYTIYSDARYRHHCLR